MTQINHRNTVCCTINTFIIITYSILSATFYLKTVIDKIFLSQETISLSLSCLTLYLVYNTRTWRILSSVGTAVSGASTQTHTPDTHRHIDTHTHTHNTTHENRQNTAHCQQQWKSIRQSLCEHWLERYSSLCTF